MLVKEQFGKLFFDGFDGEVNQALIQRCVDKGLFDKNSVQDSIDMQLVALGRRIINQPELLTAKLIEM